MKVYAQYFEVGDRRYRKHTLLQFGDGTDLLGSCVLANPGSAKPIKSISNDELASIEMLYATQPSSQAVKPSNWYVFDSDPTMQQIEKIFNGFYAGLEPKLLSGFVQLFNTFNLINQNLEAAIKQAEFEDEHLLSIDTFMHFQDKPVYFGFSKGVLANEKLRVVAKNLFENTSSEQKAPYQPLFEQNKFYHPGYVNRAYKQSHFETYKSTVMQAMCNR